MKFDGTFLRSKVARRLFTLFICCAILPIGALGFLTFSAVTRQLSEQSQRRLHQASKAIGMGILERLLFLDADLKRVAFQVGADPGGPPRPPSEEPGEELGRRFVGLALVAPAGEHTPLLGRMHSPAELGITERQQLVSGGNVVVTRFPPDDPPRIFIARALVPHDPRSAFLLGEIETTFLWGTGDESTLPPLTELCVLDRSNHVLVNTLPVPPSFLEQLALQMTPSSVREFEWRDGEKEYIASYWPILLQPRFSQSQWTVVLSESKVDVFAAQAHFKKTLSLVILLTLLAVLLLSTAQIRTSLTPLEKLREGTQRIAARDFDSRVTITSGDEFEELAVSFNLMAHRVGRQFHALATMAEIDRGILSVLDTKEIVHTVLARMSDILRCDCVGVTLLDSRITGMARTYLGDGNPEKESVGESTELTAEDVQELRANPESLLKVAENVPHYLVPLAGRGVKSFLLLPIFLKQSLSGIVSLGFLDTPVLSQEDVTRTRQLADQVAVALSNARLIEELDQLYWQTVAALARAIDAKSHWTLGHSERVAKLAIKIGRVVGLSPKELDVLHRGALLHDIGKIGIPTAILDKPGNLTHEEIRVIRTHPRAGARILEPITGYAEVVPIVLQHHERYDGLGYPDGIAGEAISFGGRILAVADVFDALISDRPYRPAWGRDRIIEFIWQAAGHHFDPRAVQAFLEVMAEEDRESQGQTAPTPSLVAL